MILFYFAASMFTMLTRVIQQVLQVCTGSCLENMRHMFVSSGGSWLLFLRTHELEIRQNNRHVCGSSCQNMRLARLCALRIMSK